MAFLSSYKMGSFDDTLAVACKEGDLNKVKKLVLEDDFDVNSASFRNKVGVNPTVKRFQDFSVTQILREIKFSESLNLLKWQILRLLIRKL